MSPVIRVVGLVHVEDGRLLVVRARHQGAFYLPGGKLEPGETEQEALHREVREELLVGIVDGSVRQLGRYRAPAYGEGPDTVVDMACYFGVLDGSPEPAAEIAELTMVTEGEYAAHPETAPAIRLLLRDLAEAGTVHA
ncbi:NUDIX domain-containing protein [Solihabitans fulvus]|uniref:NUDIX domain-containing protein n=1 Tax=Solihabitans fulvus TaxID=1892852 RepID=A0A5B2XL60_9PSEU|nr:NUDIX domain-containing protein [Solihabitans fulvus]KAA2264056.1 NUDIX domain-containing protein [Solihabitans fulvus]